MEIVKSTVEEIVYETLNHHYSRFAAKPDAKFVASIVALLDDPSNRDIDKASSFESGAVYQVRMLLWETFMQGVTSVKAVVQIFNRLERAEELGWLNK